MYQNLINQNQSGNYNNYVSATNGNAGMPTMERVEERNMKMYYAMINRKLVVITDNIGALNAYISISSPEDNIGGEIKIFTDLDAAINHINCRLINLIGIACNWNFYEGLKYIGIPRDKIIVNRSILLSQLMPGNLTQKLGLLK